MPGIGIEAAAGTLFPTFTLHRLCSSVVGSLSFFSYAHILQWRK